LIAHLIRKLLRFLQIQVGNDDGRAFSGQAFYNPSSDTERTSRSNRTLTFDRDLR
jgi:hypothetical protein